MMMMKKKTPLLGEDCLSSMEGFQQKGSQKAPQEKTGEHHHHCSCGGAMALYVGEEEEEEDSIVASKFL